MKQYDYHGSSAGNLGSLLDKHEQKSLFNHLIIGVIALEGLITLLAITHGLTTMTPGHDGTVDYQFPWKGYLIAVFVAPIALMLVMQVVSWGFARLLRGEPQTDLTAALPREEDEPSRTRRMLSLLQGLPAALSLIGLMLLGGFLFYLDAIMAFVVRLGEAALEMMIWVGSALFAVWLISYGVRLYMMYKTRRMEEEFAFRREVLDKTGLAILDKKTVVTSDGRMLTSNGNSKRRSIEHVVEALPAGESSDATESGAGKDDQPAITGQA